MSDESVAAPRVLLTVSGRIPADIGTRIADGRRPRADYLELARRMGAEVVDVGAAEAADGRVGRALRRVAGTGPMLAWSCFRRRRTIDVVVTDGEQVGIPFALLTRLFGRRGSRHMMIVHVLSVPKKSWLVRLCRLGRQIDRYVVYASSQRQHLVETLGVEPARVLLTPFMVDTRFFDPAASPVERRHMICSAGLERRDYPTLMDAVAGLDVEVRIAAASPWSKQPDSTSGRSIPANVLVERLDLAQLRDLYAASRFVVVPLQTVDFQAGVTTILEAMSMGRAVVCSSTPGQTDVIGDGRTGRYVPVGDAEALRSVIVELLADAELADEIGREARRWAVEHADIERYADRLAAAVSELSEGQ